jgi:hypothetical protein
MECWRSATQGWVDYGAGLGDALVGWSSQFRDATGLSSVVNKCSGAYAGGKVSAVVVDTVIGGAAGLEAAGANAGEAGYEFSHWLPARFFRASSPSYRPMLDSLFGWAEETAAGGASAAACQ